MKATVAVLWVGWSTALLAGLSADQSCVIEVTQDALQRLVAPQPSREPCEKVWAQLLLHVHYTRKNLTGCQERELASGDPEPSFSDCQQQLENAKLDKLDDQRYHASVLQKKLQLNEWNVRKYQAEAATVRRQLAQEAQQFRGLHRELLFAHVAAGASKQAAKYYHLYLEGQAPGRLLGELVAAVYREGARANDRLANLLDFVRTLAGPRVKLALYELIRAELLKRPRQRHSYLAVIAALDLGRVAFLDAQNGPPVRWYNELMGPALERLQRAVRKGRYGRIVPFATDYPDHFEQVENRISTLETAVWHRTDFDRLVAYPNQLPLVRQRLEAFRMLLQQINRRHKGDYQQRLVKAAGALDECVQFMQRAKTGQTEQDKLVTVKRLFAELNPNHDYDYYLKESQRQQ